MLRRLLPTETLRKRGAITQSDYETLKATIAGKKAQDKGEAADEGGRACRACRVASIVLH